MSGGARVPNGVSEFEYEEIFPPKIPKECATYYAIAQRCWVRNWSRESGQFLPADSSAARVCAEAQRALHLCVNGRGPYVRDPRVIR